MVKDKIGRRKSTRVIPWLAEFLLVCAAVCGLVFFLTLSDAEMAADEARHPFREACQRWQGEQQGQSCLRDERVLFTVADAPYTLSAVCQRHEGQVQGEVCLRGERVVLRVPQGGFGTSVR